jgi:hypothetical protein
MRCRKANNEPLPTTEIELAQMQQEDIRLRTIASAM